MNKCCICSTNFVIVSLVCINLDGWIFPCRLFYLVWLKFKFERCMRSLFPLYKGNDLIDWPYSSLLSTNDKNRLTTDTVSLFWSNFIQTFLFGLQKIILKFLKISLLKVMINILVDDLIAISRNASMGGRMWWLW